MIDPNAGSSISGTVAVSNFPSPQTISGAVTVSNFPSPQTVSGSVAVSNFPATQPVIVSPTTVYDGGVARTIIIQSNAGAVTGAAPLTVYGAVPGLKLKILSVSAACAAFTTAGIIWITDGVSPTLWLAGCTAVGTTVHYTPGFICFSSAVNTAVTLNTTGSATWHISIVAYLAA